jgi:hypothetical protein
MGLFSSWFEAERHVAAERLNALENRIYAIEEEQRRQVKLHQNHQNSREHIHDRLREHIAAEKAEKS